MHSVTPRHAAGPRPRARGAAMVAPRKRLRYPLPFAGPARLLLGWAGMSRLPHPIRTRLRPVAAGLALALGPLLAVAPPRAFAQPDAVAPPRAVAQARALQLVRIDVHPSGGAQERTVRRLLPLRVGEELDLPALQSAREALELSGAFRSLFIYTTPGGQPGSVVLVVEAELDRHARLETGFGHDPLDGWYLNLAGVRWTAPLGGAGHLRAGLRLGVRTGGVYADFAREGLGGGPFDLLARGFAGSQTWIAFAGNDEFRQQLTIGRAELGLRRRLGRVSQLTLWGGVEGVKPDTTLEQHGGTAERGASTLLPLVGGRQTIVGARLELTSDHRDAPSFTRSGSWLGARAGASVIDGGAGFGRAEADLRAFVPLPRRSVLALRAAGAWAGPGAPYYERLVFGGIGTVRGFRDASLSGPRGARATWLASAELRRPLAGRAAAVPRLTGLVFVDWGQHWDRDGNSANPALGAGYGIRLRVPWVQIFGLDVGIPLTDTATRDPYWVHGSLGFTF